MYLLTNCIISMSKRNKLSVCSSSLLDSFKALMLSFYRETAAKKLIAEYCVVCDNKLVP